MHKGIPSEPHTVADRGAQRERARGLRIVSDLPIPQLPWWSDTVTVLPWPTRAGSLGVLIAAWNTIRRSRDADAFVGSTLRNAMALGLFKRVTRRRRPTVVLTEMRLDEPQPGWRWLLKLAIQRYAFRAVNLMCVSARQEAPAYAERLRLPADRFRFVPWHTNVLAPAACPATGDHVFAAGRTGRDWRTLADAVRGLPVRLTIVCSHRDATAIAFPDNVTVLTDVTYATYRTLLEQASVVVIPLEPHVYSSGQVVILEAMALGKPVVVTRVTGSEDYVQDGVDGLLVAPGDAAEMRAALAGLLASKQRQEALGAAALARVLERHTLQHYASRILEIVEDVIASDSRLSDRQARG